MRRLMSSLGIAILLIWGSGTLADESSVTGSTPGQVTGDVQPSAPLPTVEPAELLPRTETPAKVEGRPAETVPAPALEKVEKAPGPLPPVDLAVLKLKAQIKTVRLSLAETTGRLAVTERDLTTANADNTRLRAENTALQTNLAKAETIGKKAEEEVIVRRQEMRTLEQRGASTPSGSSPVGLLLALAVAMILAVVALNQGGKLRRILSRLPDGKVEEKRLEQLRTQLQAQIKDEKQRSLHLEEECKRLRDANNRPSVPANVSHASSASNVGGGSKRDKVEQARRELREARAAAEAQKRASDERIQTLETKMEQISAANRKLEVLLAKANEKLNVIAPEEVVEMTAANPD